MFFTVLKGARWTELCIVEWRIDGVNLGASTAAGTVTVAVCLEQPLLNTRGTTALVIKSGLSFR